MIFENRSHALDALLLFGGARLLENLELQTVDRHKPDREARHEAAKAHEAQANNNVDPELRRTAGDLVLRRSALGDGGGACAFVDGGDE
jgi:hypothetical protein